MAEVGVKPSLRCDVLTKAQYLLSNMDLNKKIVIKAIHKAAQGHSDKIGVELMLANEDDYADKVISSIKSGEYKKDIGFRPLIKKNANGKIRHINSPNLFTFVLEHLFLLFAVPIYKASDNYNALNCKEGCGITSNDKRKSIASKVKHVLYDRRDLAYGIVIDQRKCYEYVRPKIFRKEMRRLTTDKELIEFGIEVGFFNNRLPIGAPTSSFIHHVVMLRFDFWMKQASPFAIRFADDNFAAVYTKSEGSQLKWRIQNFWWYELQIRAKATAIRLQPLDEALSFCGLIVTRNSGCKITDHNKGFTRIRQNIRQRAQKCKNDESWASYYGIMKHADCYALMQKIENKMKLRQLTEKIRINRNMDAPNINPRDLAGKVFTIYDYELKSDSKGNPNWIKCLIGIEETDDEGNPTGKMKAFEFHGSYMFIVEFIVMAEHTFGKKNMLPLEEMEIENQCGYIFKGSTNQMEYIG